jgi:hypothetical protein
MPKDQVFLKLGTPEIEITMTQPQLFGGQWLAADAGDRNRGRRGWTDQGQLLGSDLDIAGWELSVSHLRWSRDNFALEKHHALGTETRRQRDRFRGRVARIERDLHEARPISEIDEYQLPEIALAVNPATEANVGSGIGRS